MRCRRWHMYYAARSRDRRAPKSRALRFGSISARIRIDIVIRAAEEGCADLQHALNRACGWPTRCERAGRSSIFVRKLAMLYCTFI